MSLLVVVLVFLVVPVRAWVINTSTDQIVPGDANGMWLECRQTSAAVDTVQKFVITKYTACGGKTSITDINENNDIHKFLPEAKFTVTGNVFNDTSKFLRLTWSEVDVEDAGRYGCEVKGFDVLGNVLNIELKTKEVRVKQFTMADVKRHIQAIKDEDDVTRNRLKSEMERKHKHLASEVANLKSLMKGCMCQLQTEPPTSPTTLPTTTPSPTTLPISPDDDKWPLAKYALIGPECPVSHSSDIVYKGCFDLEHYKGVIASTNETLCSCSLNVRKSSRSRWPKGSYCIRPYGNCHQHFRWWLLDKNPISSPFGLCCRSDGSTSDEIDLPTKTSFYLFTNRGNVCQQVKGMNVTQTYLVYETKVGIKYREKKRLVVNSPRLCHYVPV